MSAHSLESQELCNLIGRVFVPTSNDQALAILVDLPDAQTPDRPRWRERRLMAQAWARALAAAAPDARYGLQIHLVAYRNVRMNNADLPERAWLIDVSAPLPAAADDLAEADAIPFERVFAAHSLILAPTELSTTAPLKLAAKRFGFSAATMPGLSAEMIPALRLDYTEVSHRVRVLKELLDGAAAADILFETTAGAATAGASHRLLLDLRHRQAHASGGLLPTRGTAGNLPSGEAYIVPYEGEVPGDPSRSAGELPVELEGEVVIYRIEHNRAVALLSGGPVSTAETAKLAAEPAYGNLAELGLGVLKDFGVRPCGEVLLDEKLGLHIAFGRSDHFGGQVGHAQFSRPEAVVHIDRVYVPEAQPHVRARLVTLVMQDGARIELMRDGRYAIDFARTLSSS